MEVTWLKDNRPLNATDRVHVERDGLTCRLIVTDVTPQDEGKYTITAKDQNGEAKADTAVVVSPKRDGSRKTSLKIVKGPPGPVENLQVEDVTTDTIALTWEAPSNTGGSRIVEYKLQLRTPDQQSWVEAATVTRTRFTVKKLPSNTEYLFRVAAVNVDGLGEWSSVIKASTVSAGTKPQFTEAPPSSLTVMEGQLLNISAKFSGTPSPSVKWYRDRREITDLDSISIDSHSTSLTIAEARHGVDDSLYSCLIENDMGQAASDISVSIILSSEDATEIDSRSELSERIAPGAPSLLKPLTDETVQAGQQITLTCRITAKNGKVAWYHNDDRVKSTGRYELFSSHNGVQKLICHSSNQKDSGTYRCVVMNDKGMAHTECEVVVKDAAEQVTPTFEQPLQDTTTLVGKDLVLKCSAVGCPDPELVWTKDGERLATSRRVKLVFDEKGGSELHIRDCCAHDAGIYLCTATNTAGVQSTQCTLTVVEIAGADAHLVIAEAEKVAKPRFIRAPPSTMDVHEGGQFKLIAKVHGVPEPELKWYYIDDAGNITSLTEDEHGWIECRGGEVGQFVLNIVEQLKDEHAGPPRFLRCLRDIWTLLGDKVVFEVEVAGYPAPDLTWYHQDKRVMEGKNVKSASAVRMEMRRKGAPPVFIQGLEDMELQAGDSAAVAGKLARSESKGSKSARMEARGLAAALVAGLKVDEDSPRQSTEESKQDLGKW
ncbi:immunoglobulin I-set domain protein [Ancylostoma ceylanicum]|uniref:Immunoglobulin I-set domain protein n=1 Tax=Ancylostoma ceylanicum TaxID=53326 RepID=A0A0D6LDB2_9BILA|nr:immunoglobulin I-set domain protein [Ancylostoma ceylanicum]